MNLRLSVALALAVGVAVGFAAARLQQAPQPVHAPAATVVTEVVPAPVASPEHRLLDEVVSRIRREYVEAVPETVFDEAAVKGIVARLDPHSSFLDAAQYEEMRATTTGSYSGVGIEVSAQDGRVVVVTPIEGSPAARAGVRAGDVVLAVDGQPVTADKLEETIGRMRGTPGTLVRITQFSDSTPGDLLDSLGGLMRRDDASPLQPLRGLVLDLRGNPGGVLESAVSVADAFLESGLIVRADGRTPESRFQMSATPGDVLDGEPIVVLVDSGSASGSEIVAGALRDHGRAALMGERTFGKGSVQTVIPLRDGQALKLTTSRYYTPAGVSIHEKGIEPDIVIRRLAQDAAAGQPRDGVPAVKDPAVLTALQYLRDRSLGTQYAAAPGAAAQ